MEYENKPEFSEKKPGETEKKAVPTTKNARQPIKILAVGDVHGREVLSRIEPANYDRIVFIGDYVDTHYEASYSDVMILENLKKIIEFKKRDPGKVILLLGNHDVHYMYHDEVNECSGFRKSMLADLQWLFNENSALFDMACQYSNTLFTHAGVSNTWYRRYSADIQQEISKVRGQAGLEDNLVLSEKFNYLRSSIAGRKILFKISGLRNFPRDIYQSGGIIWADKQETAHDYLKGYNQVVGHTVVGSIEKKMGDYDESSSITYIDTENREFLEVRI